MGEKLKSDCVESAECKQRRRFHCSWRCWSGSFRMNVHQCHRLCERLPGEQAYTVDEGHLSDISLFSRNPVHYTGTLSKCALLRSVHNGHYQDFPNKPVLKRTYIGNALEWMSCFNFIIYLLTISLFGSLSLQCLLYLYIIIAIAT